MQDMNHLFPSGALYIKKSKGTILASSCLTVKVWALMGETSGMVPDGFFLWISHYSKEEGKEQETAAGFVITLSK